LNWIVRPASSQKLRTSHLRRSPAAWSRSTMPCRPFWIPRTSVIREWDVSGRLSSSSIVKPVCTSNYFRMW
jgi:hypothetical protein